MTTAPIWFGTDERPLLGFFHTPDQGEARAAVVICPPLDREYMHAHYALRLLAEHLADLGICALRFDYDGTGDSAGGPQDPDRVGSWLGSVAAAVDVVRAAGATSIVLVGMRAGALLAGVTAERHGELDGLVLWDPVVSGRAYLSEQRALHALAFKGATERADGSIETPGTLYDASTVGDLRSLDLSRSTGPLARDVLVLSRPDRESARLAKRLDLPNVEWSHAKGQAELMDVGSPNQVMPYDDIARIGDWIAAKATAPATPVLAPPTAQGAIVALAPDGTPVIETPMSLGPAGLFGILTDVPGRTSGPTALFLNVANEHRIGPARLWVDLARQWAGAGVRSFRLDLSGMGDSPTRSADQQRFVTRAPEAFEDVIDTCQALHPDDPSEVILVGLCASGYQALDSAFDVHPRGVVAINPVLSFQPPEIKNGDPLDPRRHVAIPRRSATQAFHGDGPLTKVRRRFPRLNDRARDLSETIEGILASPQHRPVVWLQQLTGQDVDVLIVCGEREARPVKVSATPMSLRRLGRTGRFRLDVIPGLEHGLLIAEQRQEVKRRVTRYVFGLAGGTESDGFVVGEITPAQPSPPVITSA